jgi:branched-chain amino acid transport system permease protein
MSSSRERARRVALGVALFVAVACFTQLVLPGREGGRGTPAAIIFSAVVGGLVTSLTAAGIILIYRSSRFITFAQTAVGAAGATLCFQLMQFTKVPFLLAFLLGLVLSGAVGLAFDLVFGRRFYNAPRLVLTVLTIVAAGFIGGVASNLVSKLPFFPAVERRTLEETIGAIQLRDKLPLHGFSFRVGALPIPFGFAEVFAIEIAIISLLALAAFFRYTRAGVAIRAVAENAERASLLGISVGMLSSAVWIIAGLLSGASVTLSGVLATPVVAQGFAPEVLLPALAAAVVARMQSLPIAVAAAIGIAVVSRAIAWSFPDDAALVDLGLLVVVGAGLLLQRRRASRADEQASQSWRATDEQRPIPRQLLDIGSLALMRRALIVLGLLAVGIYPFVTSTGQTNLGGVIALNAIVALSLVVLTGWAGQVSLGQYGLVAVGAITAGALSARAGVPFWVAVPVATVFTAAFAALVGLPALRLQGLFLAVTTFAFSVAAASILFSRRYFGWLLPPVVERPRLFFIDFDDERSMYYLCVAALVASIAVLANLRRSRFGRVLIGLRENENNVRSFGVQAVRTKLFAFAASGALAGFAGAIFAHQQRGLSADSYSAGASIDVFVLAVIGGISSPWGALLGAGYGNAVRYFVTDPTLRAFVVGAGTLLLLYAAPGGLWSILVGLRDAVLRVIAQRRQLIVPSLFADYDPEVLERRLVPLAEPIPRSGLAALPAHLRFAVRSGLYGPAKRASPAVGGRSSSDDSITLQAAASSAEETVDEQARRGTRADGSR